jgi:HlyD family secretion protein
MNRLRILATHMSYQKRIALVAAGVVGLGAYWYFFTGTPAAPATYTIGTVERGTLTLRVTATGQVSSSNQVDLKTKVSGDVTSVPAKTGQTVRAGSPLLFIDSREAQKAVRDARTNLATAQLALEKARKPTEALTLTQAQNRITASHDTLAKSYDDGYNSISNAFLDLPSVMSGLEDVLYGTKINATASQANIDAYGSLFESTDAGIATFKLDAATKYRAARTMYDAAFAHYRTLTRAIDATAVEKEIKDTYALTKTIADSVKSSYDYLSYIEDKLKTKNQTPPPLLATHTASLNSFTAKTNTHLASLLSITNTITTTKRSLTEYEQSLADLQAGTDVLDIESARLSVVQRQNALTDALEKLSDYTVRAPFAGTIASLDIQRGQSVVSGSAFGVLVTQDKIAEVSLNEVDIATVKNGQKATLTFDAVEDLQITGTVVAVETIGTVTQGVVTYTVKIGFDTQKGELYERIRPGMSVSADIITNTKTDVLLIPASSIKTSDSRGTTGTYVEIPPPLTAEQTGRTSGLSFPLPLTQQSITTGLTDDTVTEVIDGLSEGDTIITRTVKTTSTAPAAPSLFGTMRPPGTGGGAGAATGSPRSGAGR